MKGVNVFQTTRRIIFGNGSISRLPEELKRFNVKKLMIITDPGIVESGIISKIQAILEPEGFEIQLFQEVEPDPRYEIVENASEQIKKHKSEAIIGIGGGSPIDIAKVTAVHATNDKSIRDFFGIDLIPLEGLKTILIPTTAGTGSEVTPIAILSDEAEKLKKGIVSPHLFPDASLLDPELTLGLPAHVTAATGMDALIHAIEAYTSRNANPFTDPLAERAISLVYENIRKAYADGENIEARSNMLEGSLLAGMAFANAGVTAVHAFAYPIGAEFHIPHGMANSIMLLPVMKFNLLGNMNKFAKVAALFGENISHLSTREAAYKTIAALEALTADLNIPGHLSEFGVQKKDVPALAEGVMKVTRLLANNPRKIELEDARQIYESVI
ncbi:MAG: iron-containing alcohol dehydrogenase [Desulfobacteraceae bacterium]|nr:iron-containing alcohol dehydrogenase [Desulfobacteraceae bacterium]